MVISRFFLLIESCRQGIFISPERNARTCIIRTDREKWFHILKRNAQCRFWRIRSSSYRMEAFRSDMNIDLKA
jgi:hypothetical protein